MAFSHLSTSNSDTLSVRSYGSSSRGSIRLIVVLPDDALTDSHEIGVPVPESMTISELQREALRRARALGLTIHRGDFNLRLDSQNGPIAFPEDVVFDVVDTVFAAKVWLVPTAAASKSSKHQAEVYIRWITPARALDFSTLSSISPDLSPISRETAISELKGIATDRIYDGPSSNEAPLLSGYQVQLFLAECPLCMTNEKDIRIGDLLCDTEGSLQHPLDIYIVPISGEPSDADSPETLWAFESTKRGTAAFLTCLKLAINQARIAASDAPKRRLLKTYFRVTHFTPALTAIHTLIEENKLEPDSVAILATCFRELALRMVPSELFGHSVKAVLEGSRQIFAWLDSELRETPGEIDDPEAALVRSVEFKEITNDQILNEYRVGKRCDIVEFKASGDPMRTGSSSEPHKIRQVKVWTAANCKQNVRLLALAMWGHYDPCGDFYVDFRDNMENPFDERRIPLTSPGEFPRLLTEANSHPHLRMTGPEGLKDCPTAITLSTEGYVSVFDKNVDFYQKDVRPTIWNAVSGTKMLDSGFIKTLETALEPIIKQRKVEGTWALDDWQYTAKSQSVDVTPHEAIVICFDLSYSMAENLGHEWIGAPNDLDKLSEIKQVFQNVIARMAGYHLLINHIGVITFSDRNLVTVTTELTQLSDLPEDFKDMMGDKEATGCTALWDAVDKAKDMLLAFKQKHPNPKLRIIVLTDGDDNESQKNPADLCRELYDAEIVFDSLAVGSGKTSDLFKISKHTGGYAFKPTSRMLLYQIFLLEPFLDISVRPDIERVPLENYNTSSPKEPDMKTTYDFPLCRPHPLEKGSFISLSDCRRLFPSRSVLQNQTRTSSLARRLILGARPLTDRLPSKTVHPRILSQSDTVSVTSDRSTMSSGRVLMKEIDFIILNQESYFDVYVNEIDMSFWKVVMAGPVGSPYDKGNFVLSVRLTETFPQTPPLIRFLTPVLHPNITKHGRVCHAIFTKNWEASYHVHTVLQYMYELLKDPEPGDAIDELATTKFWTDRATADAEIRKYVEKFAIQTRDALKLGILKQAWQ